MVGKFAGGPLIFLTKLSVCVMSVERFVSVILVPGGKPSACENFCCVNPPSVALQNVSSIVPSPSPGSSSPIVPDLPSGSVAVITRSGITGRAALPEFAAVPAPPPVQAASKNAAIATESAAIFLDMK